MLKRTVCTALAAVLIFSLCSCRAKEKPVTPIDITGSLEDLGINDKSTYLVDTDPRVISRNPYDMQVFEGKVYVSNGNYQDNTGPVKIYSYQNDSTEATRSYVISTEQVDELYVYDGCLFALETDPQTWGASQVCFLKPGEEKWTVINQALNECIHCFDMVEFEGSLFFCGSSIGYPGGIESSKSSVYRLDKDITEAGREDFTEVFSVNRSGDVITYGSTSGVPRYYELFVLRGELYAVYYSSYSSKARKGKLNFSGIYKYDRKSGQFVYDKTADAEPIFDEFRKVRQDKTSISHDFALGGYYYFLFDNEDGTLLRTKDLKSYEKVTVPGHENAAFRDVIFIKNKPYILASEKTDDGYINYVFQSGDFNNFSLHYTFKTPLFARSFEYLDGSFYFGLGFCGMYFGNAGLPLHSEECGRILRYKKQ